MRVAALPRFPRLLRAVLVAAAFASCAPLHAGSETGLPFVRVFGRNDYRGHAQVWTAVADARGLLYFGNYAQVLVHDGVRWERIPVAEADAVRALAIDLRGRLWVGAAGALGYIDTVAAVPVFVSLADQLPPDVLPGTTTQVHVLGGAVYFLSADRLLRWRDERFTVWPLPDDGPWNSVVLGDRLVLQNPLHDWLVVGEHAPEPLRPALPVVSPVRFAMPPSGGRQLLGTIRGNLLLYQKGNLYSAPRPGTTDELLFLPRLFGAAALPGGGLAVNLLESGTLVLRPDLSVLTWIDKAAGLPDVAAKGALADSHGGLWLCLDDGIARVDARFACSWFHPPGPTARIDHGALARFGGGLYLAGSRDLFRLSPPVGLGVAGWTRAVGFDENISGLLAIDDGLLVATRAGCYVWRDDGEPRLVAPPRDCTALLASTARPGLVFAGGRDGLFLLRREQERWHAGEALPGVPGPVRALHEEPDGTLWAGTETGDIMRVHFPPGDATPEVAVFSAPDEPAPANDEVKIGRAGGRPLFATAEGLRRFDPTRNRLVAEPAYGVRFADGSTRVRAFAEGSDGSLWIAPRHAGDTRTWSETTLGRVLPGGAWRPLAIPDPTRIGDIVRLRIERPATGGEVLWAVGASGILRVDLDTLGPPSDPGVTLMREVSVLDANDTARPLDPRGETPRLPYAQNSLRFRVAAPGLAAQPGVEFETEIIGFHQGARQSGPSAEREVTNLGEGSYVFRARARAGDGPWTDPVEFAFVVRPPWWRTPAALAAWALLVVVAVTGFVRLRTRALRLRAARLENTIAERTRELHERNTELTRLHRLELDEKISARLAEEKTRLELLRYQLNPHFLFNTLNSLYSLVEDHPTAGHMVLRLSEFCRLTLTRGTDHMQTLAEELDMLSAYLDIEKVRWGDSLHIEIEADPAARAFPLPPFLLLPLVENAIKHGGQTAGDILLIRIEARLTKNGDLEIKVSNTGHWLRPGSGSAPSTRIGLENLLERLRRHYPGRHAFSVDERDGLVVASLRLEPASP